ncbi:MAG: RDD family protein [Bacteroidota bacterium]|nr:RDD family protein [Bacteroidota bacterium]MDP4192096.1 RDD family protein [Bacteroidota bacterium]MDP4196931.1 RDD family protein [Bacteroidota bacterium]
MQQIEQNNTSHHENFINAGFFRRTFAFFLDHLIVLCLIIPIFIKFINKLSDPIDFAINITKMKFGAIFTIFFLFFELYFAIFEWLWNGKTPGKWFCGIMTIKDNGENIGFFLSIIRNLLRCTYFVPPIFVIPDIISLMISPYNKRIGDYIAGTRVIRSDSLEKKEDQHFSSAESFPEIKDK